MCLSSPSGLSQQPLFAEGTFFPEAKCSVQFRSPTLERQAVFARGCSGKRHSLLSLKGELFCRLLQDDRRVRGDETRVPATNLQKTERRERPFLLQAAEDPSELCAALPGGARRSLPAKKKLAAETTPLRARRGVCEGETKVRALGSSPSSSFVLKEAPKTVTFP